ncbi:MAG: hypothetical protein Q4D02_06410 [Clostridia bacterium]|nr:hypothetical protein [Clostridia bacterium]
MNHATLKKEIPCGILVDSSSSISCGNYERGLDSIRPKMSVNVIYTDDYKIFEEKKCIGIHQRSMEYWNIRLLSQWATCFKESGYICIPLEAVKEYTPLEGIERVLKIVV